MTLVGAIDPGSNGAAAIYDTETRRLVSVEDLPFWFQSVGKKKRQRLDPIGLVELFDMFKFLGVDLVILEAVGGRPRQSAAAGFVFGYTVGLVYMACITRKIPIETVPPQHWKKMMKVPGKKGAGDKAAKKQADADIKNRVQEIFPDQQEMFYTPRGAYRMDRADAALLAKFGGDFVLRTLAPLSPDADLSEMWRNADTGA